MNEHAMRVEVLVGQLMATVREPWESLRMTLDTHAWMQMGDIDQEGSGAWHLFHIAEIFRVHAKAAMGEWGVEIDQWPAIERTVAGAGRMVREDVERFSAWCIAHPERCTDVMYGESMSFDEMIGVMLRHIVWHAAAIHYWCTWKG